MPESYAHRAAHPPRRFGDDLGGERAVSVRAQAIGETSVPRHQVIERCETNESRRRGTLRVHDVDDRAPLFFADDPVVLAMKDDRRTIDAGPGAGDFRGVELSVERGGASIDDGPRE